MTTTGVEASVDVRPVPRAELLEGRTAAVVGANPCATEVGAALIDHGCRVGFTDGPFASRAEAEERLAPSALGLPSLDAIAYVYRDQTWAAARRIVDTSEQEFTAATEDQVRIAMFASQAAYTHFAERGGRLVFVLPTVALTGAEDLAPYAAGAESVRGMAKSIARQWGPRGITVNIVAVPLTTLASSKQPTREGRWTTSPWPSPLGRAPQARADVGTLVAFLVSGQAGFVTGTTTVLDGGVTMP